MYCWKLITKHWKTILFIIFAVPFVWISTYLLHSLQSQSCITEIVTYRPCISSALLDSKVACHDSYTCEQNQTYETSTQKVNMSRRAFVSALFTDNSYLQGALLLGHTLKKYHPQYNMYILYFKEKLSNKTLCSLSQIGWIPRPVHNISPPLEGTASNFIYNFNKLILWNMTDFDSIIFLDADTLVLGDIAHLHELVADPSRTRFEFAAVADNWYGEELVYHFNAGVLVVHPSTAVFNELIRTMSLPGNYDPTMAEQAFLNAFFHMRYLQLPFIYNANLALYKAYPDLWIRMQDDLKIVHFTIVKPFRNRYDQHDKSYDFLVKPFLNLYAKKYSIPLKLYHAAWDEYMKTSLANHVITKCV